MQKPVTLVVESHNWNSKNGALFRVANGVNSTFPESPWGEIVQEGDILKVETPYNGRPRAVFTVPRAETMGSGADLLIARARVGGQRSGVVVRSVEEMNGRKVLLENNEDDSSIINIMMNWNQSAFTFPQGWTLDFFNTDDTPDIQEAYFAKGQVIWPGPGQTWSFGEGVNNYGPYKAGEWYRITAKFNNEFEVTRLSPGPTPTPYVPPTKGWQATTLNSYQATSPGVKHTCGAAVKNWASGSVEAGTTSNELGVFDITNSDWQSLKVYIYDSAVNQPAIPGRRAQLVVTHPGTAHSSVTINGTPVPVKQNRYPVFRRWGVELMKVEDNRVWMYIYDGQRGERSILGSDFNKPDVSSELRCFSLVQEYR